MEKHDETIKNICWIGVVFGIALVAVMFWKAISLVEHRPPCRETYGTCEVQS